MISGIPSLLRNPSFWSPCMGWLLAQLTKVLLNRIRSGRVDFQYLVSLGGMPSAHASMAAGLAASVGINAGFSSQVFATTLFFAAVVMFDAATVRRAASLQARLLNDIVDELFHEHRLSERKVAELLGHTRLEVLMGALMGTFMALLVNAYASR